MKYYDRIITRNYSHYAVQRYSVNEVKQELLQLSGVILTTQMRLRFPTFCRKQWTFL